MASTRGQLGGAGLVGEPNPGAFPSGGELTGASAITAGQGAVVRCLTAKYRRAARSEQRAGCLGTGKEQASGPFPVRSEQRNISGRLAQNSEPVASEQAKNRLRGRSPEPGLIARSFPRPIPAARPGANAGSWSRGNPGQLPGADPCREPRPGGSSGRRPGRATPRGTDASMLVNVGIRILSRASTRADWSSASHLPAGG